MRSRVLAAIDQATTPVRALVFDANGVSDVDYTGAQEFAGLIRTLADRGVSFHVARVSHVVHHDFRLGGLLTSLGSDHLHPTVADAVAAVAG